MKEKYFLIILVLFISCADYHSNSSGKIRNQSTHDLRVFFFENGHCDSNLSKKIISQSFLEFENNNTWGKSKEPIIFGSEILKNDSIVFLWQDSIRIVHTNIGISSSSNKLIEYSDSTKSIYHINVYEQKIIKEHKKYFWWELNYYITEDDYNFAKEP